MLSHVLGVADVLALVLGAGEEAWLLAEAVGVLDASLRDGVGEEHPHNAAVVTRTRTDRAARLDMSSSLDTSRVFILVGLRRMGEK